MRELEVIKFEITMGRFILEGNDNVNHDFLQKITPFLAPSESIIVF